MPKVEGSSSAVEEQMIVAGTFDKNHNVIYEVERVMGDNLKEDYVDYCALEDDIKDGKPTPEYRAHLEKISMSKTNSGKPNQGQTR